MTAGTGSEPVKIRKVGIGLFIGIVFVPLIFAWFTLRRGHSTISRVLSIGWAAFILIVAISSSSTDTNGPNGTSNTPVNATAPSTPDATKSPEVVSKWEYSEDKDQMRGTTTKFAVLTSENTVNLDFPYGSHTGDLQFRRRPEDGLNILLHVQGQFLCNSYNDGHVSVKFDDKPIQKFSCAEPGDASTGWLFISPASKFLAETRKSKTLVIEAPYFQNGNQQLTFSVAGLKF